MKKKSFHENAIFIFIRKDQNISGDKANLADRNICKRSTRERRSRVMSSLWQNKFSTIFSPQNTDLSIDPWMAVFLEVQVSSREISAHQWSKNK